jgi:hypothetical protein
MQCTYNCKFIYIANICSENNISPVSGPSPAKEIANSGTGIFIAALMVIPVVKMIYKA